MRYSSYTFIIAAILFVLIIIFKSKGNKNATTLLFILFAIDLFAPSLLPRQLFGKWNAIKKINGKEISKIILYPSEPDMKVNLTDTFFIISDKNQIESLTNLLHHSDVYYANHPMRIWETKMILITKDNDSLVLDVEKTENSGTVIHTPSNDWRQDDLDKILEKLVNFKQPLIDSHLHKNESKMQELTLIYNLYPDFKLKNIIHSKDTIKFFEITSKKMFDSLFEILPSVDSIPKYPDFDSSKVFCLSLVNYNEFDLLHTTNLVMENNEALIVFDISDRPYEIPGKQQIIFSLPKSIQINKFNLYYNYLRNKSIEIFSY